MMVTMPRMRRVSIGAIGAVFQDVDLSRVDMQWIIEIKDRSLLEIWSRTFDEGDCIPVWSPTVMLLMACTRKSCDGSTIPNRTRRSNTGMRVVL